MFGEVDLDLFDVRVLPERAGGVGELRVRLAPSALLVFPLVVTVNLGANLRLEQSAAWNGSVVVTGSLSAGLVGSAPPPMTVAEKFVGLQLVGLSVKLGLSM